MGEYVNTPYDDVFRTMVTDGGTLVIPLINETFHENYDGTEKILLSQNEHYLNSQDGNQDEIITDSNIKIFGKISTRDYHLECQSTPDNSMIVRFFEYDSEIALLNSEIKDSVMTVHFPQSAVIYLRSNSATPDELKIIVKFPKGGYDGQYTIPIVKIENYTLDYIFKMGLWFLIPFYIFNYEKEFGEYERNEDKLLLLIEEYKSIKTTLDKAVENGKIDEYRKCMIIDMTKKVLLHLARDYESIKKGVEEVMGGKVLEYEAKTIYNNGREEGREVGSYETLIRLVDGNIISLKQAAEQVGMTETEFKEKINQLMY